MKFLYYSVLKMNKQTLSSKYLIFASITLVVVVFNLIVFTGLDVLLHDDPKHYKMAIEGEVAWGMMKHFVLWPFTEYAAWKLMAYSAPLARAVYVLLLMVPLSCCFYYLYRYKFGFSSIAAFTAAVLPNILPHQWQIPAGINMSRTLYPLLFAVFALILGLHYLEKSTAKNWLRLVGSALCYLLCSQMMEQALFLFPPLALVFLGYTKWKPKHAWLLFSFFIIAAARYAQMVIFTRKTRVFTPIEDILTRTGLYLKYSLPSPAIDPLYLAVFYIGIFFVGFILFLKHPTVGPKISEHVSHMKRSTYIVYLYGFFTCWAAATILPFITMGGVIFPPRYSYISAFGINALFIFSLFVLLNRGFLKKYKLHYFLFIGIMIFSGVYRYVNLKKMFDGKNSIKSVIVRTLENISFPENAQVVICGLPGMAHGKSRASGYLMHALNRNDIDGIFKTVDTGEEDNFYDHFNPWGIAPEKKGQFHGFFGNKPTFFFKRGTASPPSYKKGPGQDQFKQYEYVLRWRGKTKAARWKILHAHLETGKLAAFQSGEGLDAYVSAVKELETRGISQSEILWGGPPTKKELKRLEQQELDPRLFRFGFYFYPYGFKKTGLAMVKKYLSMPGAVDLSAKDMFFQDRFQLVGFLPDDISDETGNVTRIIHLLWKSLAKQTINKHRLEINVLAKGKVMGRQRIKFCKRGLRLRPGDYILGNVKIPGEVFAKGDQLSIRMIAGSISSKIQFSIFR